MSKTKPNDEQRQRLGALLDEAQALDAGALSAWLDVTCVDKPALRDEIEASLVAKRVVGRQTVASPENRPATFETTASWDQRQAAPLPGGTEIKGWLAADAHSGAMSDRVEGLVGRRVGPYVLGRQIGRGSMGVVYQANDTRLDRMVALKVLPAGVQGDADKVRFLREARAASAIDHPNICTVHDVGETQEGRLFLVMAFYGGETLASRLARGPLAITEAIDLATQVARGLACAHDGGVVHRDIKPANIMITAAGVAKILDFGIARVIGALGLTSTGVAIGTPAYMAPEQARGEPVDARADIWALGVMLYEMLAGRRPFRADNVIGMSHAIVETEPEPIEGLRRDVPKRVARVVHRALAKSVDARYPNMRGLLVDLEAMPSAVDSDAKHQGPWQRWKVWAAVIPLLVLGVWGAANWVGVGQTDGARNGLEVGPEPTTPLDFERIGEAALARYWRPGQVDRAVDSYQRAVALDQNRAPAYAGLGRALWRRYRADRDRAWLEQAEANARRAVELDEHLTDAQVTLGLILLAQGHRGSAQTLFEGVLRRDPANVDAYRGLGGVWQRAGDTARAEIAFKDAVSLRPADFELHAILGGYYFRLGRYQEAEASFVRSRELDLEDPSGYKNVAAALHMQGRFAEAARQLQEALALRPEEDVYGNLGTVYYFQGLFAEAASAFEKAMDMGANDYRTWGNLGDAYRWLPGRRADAVDAFDTALLGISSSLRTEPADAGLLALAAEYDAKRGEFDAARTKLDAFDKAEGIDASSLFNAVQATAVAGDIDRALGYLRGALDAGFSRIEIRGEPDLAELRKDPRFHREMAAVTTPGLGNPRVHLGRAGRHSSLDQ